MENLPEWLQFRNILDQEVISELIVTLIILFLIFGLRRWIIAISTQRLTDPKQIYNFKRNSGYIATILLLFFVGIIWFEDAQQIATYLGLLSAGVAIAMRDLLVSFFGWIYILWQRPFSIGDRIQIGEYAGDVIDINLFQFVFLEIGNWVDADQSTGRIVHIPNGKVLTDSTSNYTEEFNYIWNEISFTITFESNWEKAKKFLQEITERNSPPLDETTPEIKNPKKHKYYYFFTHLGPTVYTSIQLDGIQLTTRYLCQPRHRRSSEKDIIEDILKTIQPVDDIQFAYATQRNIINLKDSAPETFFDKKFNEGA